MGLLKMNKVKLLTGMNQQLSLRRTLLHTGVSLVKLL